MKTLDELITELSALRAEYGGNVRVALFADFEDLLARAVGSVVYSKSENLDHEVADNGECITAPAIIILPRYRRPIRCENFILLK